MIGDPGAPRLLVVNTTNRRRGAELRSVRIAEELKTRGWEVVVVSLTTEPSDPTIGALALTKRSPDELGAMNIDVLLALLRLLAGGGHDLVLANGSSTLRYLAVAGRLRLSRRRLGYMSIGDPSYWAESRGARLRMGSLLRAVGWVLAVSEAAASGVRAIAGPTIDVEVVHGGVPESFLEIDRPPRSGPLRAVFIGSLTPEKDPESAVEVVAAAPTDVRLRLVGGGALKERIIALASELGIADRIEVVGPRADITEDLAWAHVLLLTSKTEGLPGVVLEAAAAGVPALAFDAGGTNEIVHDRQNGRLLPLGDRMGLAEALAEVALADELRLAWGDNARRMVRERYLIRHAADRYDQALRRRLPE